MMASVKMAIDIDLGKVLQNKTEFAQNELGF